MPPANDNFASGESISGVSGSTTGSNVGATSETGEPAPYSGSGGASVWYQWTAAFSGDIVFSTAGSTFDSVLDVFTGSAITALTLVAGNDDFVGVTSQVSFTAVAGTVYSLRVNGFGSTNTGAIALAWQPAPVTFKEFAGLSSSPGAGPLPNTITPVITSPTDGDVIVVEITQDNPGTTVSVSAAGWSVLETTNLGHGIAHWFAWRTWHTGDPTSWDIYTTEPSVGNAVVLSNVDSTVTPIHDQRSIGATENPPATPTLTDPSNGRGMAYVAAAGAYELPSWAIDDEDDANYQGKSSGGNASFTGVDTVLGYTIDGTFGPFHYTAPHAAQTDSASASELAAGAWQTVSMTQPVPSLSNTRARLHIQRSAISANKKVDVDAVHFIDATTTSDYLTEPESTFETGVDAYPAVAGGWRSDLYPSAGQVSMGQDNLTPSYEGNYAMSIVPGTIGSPSSAVDVFLDHDITPTNPAHSVTYSLAERTDDTLSTITIAIDWWSDAPNSGSEAYAFGAVFFANGGPIGSAGWSVGSIKIGG